MAVNFGTPLLSCMSAHFRSLASGFNFISCMNCLHCAYFHSIALHSLCLVWWPAWLCMQPLVPNLLSSYRWEGVKTHVLFQSSCGYSRRCSACTGGSLKNTGRKPWASATSSIAVALSWGCGPHLQFLHLLGGQLCLPSTQHSDSFGR